MASVHDFQPGRFTVASSWGPYEMDGYHGAGLGMALILGSALRYRVWHLGSGHIVCIVGGALPNALQALAAVASVCPWDAFDAPDGWQNVEPNMPEMVAALSHRFWVEPPDGDEENREQARAVLDANEGLR